MAGPVPYGMSEPLHIFQDDFFTQPNCIISHAPMPQASTPQRRPMPLQDSVGNVALSTPLAMAPPNPSPFDPTSRLQGAPLAALKSSRSQSSPGPMMPPGVGLPQAPATDRHDRKQSMMPRFKAVAQKPQPDPGMHFMGKENHPLIFPAPAPPQFAVPMENYYPKANGKRVLLDAAPIKELRPAKKPKRDGPLPPHDSFPPIVDDGVKPGHSYATLIGMAILRSPERRLTLSQIYKWISDTYSFYKPQDAGWQNSIRHNLSLNKNFIKQERPKDDPGKGNYWAIEPGSEHSFFKDKPSRKATSAENIPVMSTRLEPSQSQALPTSESGLSPLPSSSKASLPALPPSSQTAPVSLAPEAPSDATILASEMNSVEPGSDKGSNQDNGNEVDVFSPLPTTLHSSPPIARHPEPRHHGTPTSASHSSGSKSRSHKRKLNSADDSGYISSLESSVMRPNQHSKLLTSEADRPRIKRGRAEEEIARLRASSYDSPVKGRSLNYIPASSSPLRQAATHVSGQMLPPLTPASKLKAPPRPPPSASPSTNLRIHRENMKSLIDAGSPFRRVSALIPDGDNVLQMTPGWNVDDVLYGFDQRVEHNNGSEFDIFQDSPFMPIFCISPERNPAVALSPVRGNGSPVKRAAKRQRLDRSQSTSALHDISNSSLLFNGSTPIDPASFLKVPSAGDLATTSGLPAHETTPSKAFDGFLASPSKLFLQSSPSKGASPVLTAAPLGVNDENAAPSCSLPMDGMCAPDFLEDGGFGGIDMLAGFAKIGSNNVNSNIPSSRPPKPGQRMPFGRSYSTAF